MRVEIAPSPCASDAARAPEAAFGHPEFPSAAGAACALLSSCGSICESLSPLRVRAARRQGQPLLTSYLKDGSPQPQPAAPPAPDADAPADAGGHSPVTGKG